LLTARAVLFALSIDRLPVMTNSVSDVWHTKEPYFSNSHKRASKWNASCLWVRIFRYFLIC